MGKARRRVPAPPSERPAVATAPGEAAPRRAPLVSALLLVAVTVAAFWPTLANGFVDYDDPEYVTANERVLRGLSWEGVEWAFTTGTFANWHPLTWISHITDVSLFGRNAGGHHATSLLLHVLNALLVFTVFRKLTGETGRALWVAALFAVHPAHVQSVAWVAERKDVLSTLFGLATIAAYAEWVRRRGPARYGLVLALYAAGLMSKPMLVSLPVLLLLLDYWPLRRVSGLEDPAGRRAFFRLVVEKVPLLLMAAASSVVTFLLQQSGGAMRTLDVLPVEARLANAVVSYVRYLKMLFWPSDLAVFYPHPGSTLSATTVVVCALALVVVSVVAFRLRRRAPYLFVGWAWFLVALLPVIGIVQVGAQAMADRYTYLSFLGPFVALAWGIPALAGGGRTARTALRVGAVATSLVLAVASFREVRHWKNTETLFLRTLAVTKDNYLAHNNLTNYYNDNGRPAEALEHGLEAVRIRPQYASGYVNVGRSYFLLSRYDEAEKSFRRALDLGSRAGLARNNLAETMLVKGELRQAIALHEAVVAEVPDRAAPRTKLALVLLLAGDESRALGELERAVALEPSNGEARTLLDGLRKRRSRRPGPPDEGFARALGEGHRRVGTGLLLRGRTAEAIAHLRETVDLLPRDTHALTNLGTCLAREGRPDEAASFFRRSLDVDPRQPVTRNNLGMIFLEQGRREEAIEHFREALRLEPDYPLARENLARALRGGS